MPDFSIRLPVTECDAVMLGSVEAYLLDGFCSKGLLGCACPDNKYGFSHTIVTYEMPEPQWHNNMRILASKQAKPGLIEICMW